MLKVDLRQETRNIEDWSPGKSQSQIEMIPFFFLGGGGGGVGDLHILFGRKTSLNQRKLFLVFSLFPK